MQLCQGEDPKSCDESANIVECRAFMDDPEGYLREYFNIKNTKTKSKASAWHRQREVYEDNLVEEVSISGTSLFFVYLGISFLPFLPLFCVCTIIAYCSGAVRCHCLKCIRRQYHRHRRQRQQQRHQHQQQQQLRPNSSNTSVVVDYHTTETARVTVPSAPPNTTQHPSGPPSNVMASHSHPNLEVASSLPAYEDVVPPQRRSVTPEPHMLLPSYDEARLMESVSYHKFSLTSTNGPILQLLTAPPTTTQHPSAPPQDVINSHSHPNLEVASSLPMCEDVVPPQRRCVAPELHMFLPTHDEARLME